VAGSYQQHARHPARLTTVAHNKRVISCARHPYKLFQTWLIMSVVIDWRTVSWGSTDDAIKSDATAVWLSVSRAIVL